MIEVIFKSISQLWHYEFHDLNVWVLDHVYHSNNNTVRAEQNRQNFADIILRCILFQRIFCILIKISLTFIDNSLLIQVMGWSYTNGRSSSSSLLTTLVQTNISFNINNKIDISRVRYPYSRDRVTIVWPLWRHQQSIVTSSAEQKPSEWDTATMCKDRRVIVIYEFVMSCKK